LSDSSRKKGNKEVLLVFPGKYAAPDPQVPLSLLHIAAILTQENFDVRILDMRLKDYRQYRMGNPVFVGISCMSGMQIKYALMFARYFRTKNAYCPIVWGGVHPTLLPEQTVSHDLADIVVRGEGELIVKNLANHLSNLQSIDTVAGITYKSEGAIRRNPDGQVIDLDTIPVRLPYELLEIEKYPSIKSGRFHIQTSRGCPHRCSFCYNSEFGNHKWRGKSAKRVLDEIECITSEFPNIKIIDPVDDNVFVDKRRIEDICHGLLERKLNVQWRANCRFDYLSKYDKNFLQLLEKSGCVELDFGGESGSVRLQEFIHKDVTVEDMLQSVKALKNFAPSIEPYVSWMCGLPGETDEDLAQTFDLMDKMVAVNSKTQHYGIFVYTPFPSALLDFLPNEFHAPKSLEEWSEIAVFHFDPPWHSKARVAKLHTISAVTRYAFYPQSRIRERDFVFRTAYGLINRFARYRWQRRYFGFPIELKIANALARKFKGYL
jgi:anaerobic magnesium-protoporphyrin IX monomethyl ester cyclase